MAEEKHFRYDPEAEDNSAKYRLPFALCKKYGIANAKSADLREFNTKQSEVLYKRKSRFIVLKHLTLSDKYLI